jgi:hypothetical protein
VAIALRESLIALSAARLAGEGQQTKMELVYQATDLLLFGAMRSKMKCASKIGTRRA